MVNGGSVVDSMVSGVVDNREIDLISQLVRTSVTEYDEEGVMGMFSIIQPILLPPLFGCSTRGQRGR